MYVDIPDKLVVIAFKNWRNNKDPYLFLMGRATNYLKNVSYILPTHDRMKKKRHKTIEQTPMQLFIVYCISLHLITDLTQLMCMVHHS